MGIIGLETRLLESPSGAQFRVRTALSPDECQKAKEREAFRQVGAMVESAGREGMAAIIGSIESGRDADEIVVEQGGDADEGPKSLRGQFDLDWAAAQLLKSWGFRYESGRRVPVKAKFIQRLDTETREWLHDLTWEAMRAQIEEGAHEGNSAESTQALKAVG